MSESWRGTNAGSRLQVFRVVGFLGFRFRV